MPVTDRHKDYDLFIPKWRRVRDAVEGQDAVKADDIDQTYLPPLSWKEKPEVQYAAYKKRALWFGATGRTLEGITGAVFRKDPVVTVEPVSIQDVVEEWLDDITLTDVPFTSFAQDVFSENVVVSRLGVLVDMIDEEMAAETGDQQRPIAALYSAEQIVNWRARRIGGEIVVDQIVLRELEQEPAPPEEKTGLSFGVKEIEQLRVLELKPVESVDLNGVSPPPQGNLVYTVTVWRKRVDFNSQQEEWVVHSSKMPNRRGQALQWIPFVCFAPTGLDIRKVEKPTILDLADINYAHYRLDADYRHGLHFTALPTPWAAGFKTDDVLEIGSSTAWVSEDASARAGYLEFSGAGLSTIRTALEDAKLEMAVLGARLLEEQKRAVEAAETVRLRQAGEESVTVRIAKTVARGLERVLWYMAWWGTMEDEPQISVELNTDLVDARMGPAELTALIAARQSQEISRSSFVWNLKRGELLPPDREIDDEIALIEQEGPPAPLQDIEEII